MPGEVPEGWQWTRVGGECDVLIGGTPARDQPSFWDHSKQGDNRWVSIADLRDKVISETKEYITDLGVRKSNVKRIAAGTVIMSFKLSIGRTAIAGCDLYTNEAIAAFTPKTERVDRDFAYYVLPIAAAAGDIDQAVKGKTLNKAKLLDLDVLLPPLPEQKKIAAILSSVDEAIQATQFVIDQTRRVKEGLLQDLLTRGLPGHTRFKQTEIGEIPESWEVCALGDVLESLDHLRVPVKSTDRAESQGTVPYYGASGIIDWVSESLFNETLLLVGEDGANLLTRSSPIAFVISGPAWVNNHAHVYRSKGRVILDFVAHWLESRSLQPWVTGSAQPKLNGKAAARIPMPVPPLSEQSKICDVVAGLDGNIKCETAKREALDVVKSGLLQDLLTGKVRVST